MVKSTFKLSRFLFLFTLQFQVYIGYSQVYNSDIAEYIKQVEHPYTFLEKVDKLGIKTSGSSALDSSCNWLSNICKLEGYKVGIQKFLYGADTLRNIEIVKKGKSDSCIILGAHYDSWVGPGVNDNGSGDFAIYQIAKYLKPLQTNYTIRFVFFSGEEIGYLGSRYYVQQLNKDSVKIKFMLNFDQLGGTVGESNMAVKCERDEQSINKDKSSEIASFLAGCYSLYTNLTPVISPAFNSDYLAFRDSGYLIAGIYQYSSFPFYHTSADVLSNMEFNSLISIVKGALAAVLHWSEAKVPVASIKQININNDISVYSTQNQLNIINAAGFNLKIINTSGKSVFEKKINEEISELCISELTSGIYFAYLVSGNELIVKKFFKHP